MQPLSLRTILLLAQLLFIALISSAYQFGHQTRRTYFSSLFLSASSSEVLENSSSKATSLPDMEAFSNGFCTIREEIPFERVAADTIVGQIPKDLKGTYYKAGPAMFTAGSLPPPINSAVKPKNTAPLDGQDTNRMVKHPFEADGAIFAITFSHGEEDEDEPKNKSSDLEVDVAYRYRYVRTLGLEKERKKGTRIYDAMDATRSSGNRMNSNDYPLPLFRHHLQPGLNKQRKNTSNTRVIHWAQKLLSLWDGGLPYKLCSLSLSTEGKSQLGKGVLQSDAALSSKFAHDAKNKRIVFYGTTSNNIGSSSTISIYEFNSKFRLIPQVEGGEAAPQEWKLPEYALIQDGFALTDSWYVFIQPPVVLNQLQYMMSNKDPAKSISIDPKASATIYLIPRGKNANKQEKMMKSFVIPLDEYGPEINVQCINAFEQEEEDGTTAVVFDLLRSDCATMDSPQQQQTTVWPWMKTLQDYTASCSKKSIWRYCINTAKKNNDGVVSKTCLSNVQSYFPTISPKVSGQRHRFIYASVGCMGNEIAPPQGIMKLDCDTQKTDVWLPELHEFCGEPMFIPREKGTLDGDEQNGYLISLLFNGKTKKSEVIILSADKPLSNGPIARIPLSGGIPHGHHGYFCSSDESAWSSEQINRRAKLADKMETKGNRWNEVKSDFSGLGLRLDDFEEYFGEML
mmetsp:Transcript_10379/g.14942  ORF Transcript_10379/g.14942 Transcript_10379/m.14942 type:complete len:683 (+) Transcript_10379:87-2135(+)|eukprot:CAMPEP_0172414842 /NCGR_PEP_ID=MMETSP1064-20121228/1460_1 /TAXON_ID=202472 /ORGANISM="Aulacoseira subarctica , Strain CCAP 1002/5" /LENGTH=682 /DNA_ID=CAMNT_0013151691 /DNA_START=65 /DNA_END=2113 /DNA_ORIENTATION=-